MARFGLSKLFYYGKQTRIELLELTFFDKFNFEPLVKMVPIFVTSIFLHFKISFKTGHF